MDKRFILLKAALAAAIACCGATAVQRAAAQQQQAYPVWVGGIQVDGSNLDDVLGDGGGTVRYDPATHTLHLHNPAILGWHQGARIYAEGIDLVLAGSATLDNPDVDYGISVSNGSLTIDGDISAAGLETGIHTDGGGGIAIIGGTVEAVGINGYGIFAGGGLDIRGDSTRVTATSGQKDGAHAHVNLIIQGGRVVAQGRMHGLSAGVGAISISAGTVDAIGLDGNGLFSGHPDVDEDFIENSLRNMAKERMRQE